MTESSWKQYGPAAAWIALIGFALVVGVLASRGFSEARELEARVEAVADQLRLGEAAEPPANAIQGTTDDPAARATTRLEQRFLFMPAPPQGFRNVQGVLGDRVLYPGGQSFGLGDNAMGATIVAIGTNWVELEHEGQTITLDIFNGSERGPERLRLIEPSEDSSAGAESEKPDPAEQPTPPETPESEPLPEHIGALLRS